LKQKPTHRNIQWNQNWVEKHNANSDMEKMLELSEQKFKTTMSNIFSKGLMRKVENMQKHRDHVT
jgi:hypothetical protein